VAPEAATAADGLAAPHRPEVDGLRGRIAGEIGGIDAAARAAGDGRDLRSAGIEAG
jgi:hypothetical protein